jgi:hypothetical protein
MSMFHNFHLETNLDYSKKKIANGFETCLITIFEPLIKRVVSKTIKLLVVKTYLWEIKRQIFSNTSDQLLNSKL